MRHFFLAIALTIGTSQARAETPGQLLSIDTLLAIPDVTDHVVSAHGDVAWVERSGPVRTVRIARAPDYSPRSAAVFNHDDGDEIRLIGFDGQTRILFIKGRLGLNPSLNPDPVNAPLMAAHEDGVAPAIIMPTTPPDFRSPVLSGDGRSLFFVRKDAVFVRGLGDEAPSRRLFTARGELSNLLLSPDGRRLAFVSDRSGLGRGKYAFVGVFDLGPRQLRYMAPGLGMDQNPVWSPDGTRLAFIREGFEPRTWRFSDHREGAPFSIVVADAATGKGREVFVAPIGRGSDFHGFGANGYWDLGGSNSLIWLADDRLLFPYERTGWRQFYTVTVDGGDLTQRTHGEFEIADARPMPSGKGAYFLANSEADLSRLALYRLLIDDQTPAEAVALESAAAMPLEVEPTAAGALVYVAGGGAHGRRLMVQTAAGRHIRLSSIAASEADLAAALPEPQAVSFAASDGLTIPAILWRPPNSSGPRSHPVLVHSHGGSRSQVYPVWETKFGYPQVLRRFAAKGYYVLSVNFRSGTGYGLDFREPESYGGRGAGDAQDFVDAAAYLKRTYPDVDPDRMLLFGHSYGGHNVTNALARSDVYRAGITSAGVGDWVVEMEKDFGEPLQTTIPQRLELEALAYSSSAISQVDQWGEEPLLFLHGDNDRSAAMQQSLDLYLALRRRGKPAEAVVFPGEAHRIRTHANRRRYLEAIEAFADKHIGATAYDR